MHGELLAKQGNRFDADSNTTLDQGLLYSRFYL